MKVTVVDAQGEQCPIPVVKATKALDAMQEPGTLEVHVDNGIAVQNLTRLATSRGLAVSAEKLSDRHFVVTMAVETIPEKPAAKEAPACAPDRRGSLVVAVDTATMGRGDDTLGAKLMNGFLFAVSQLEELPKTILFYNGGAKITTGDGPAVEELKKMEAQGVEILTCGTCLDYYGLKDKLAVGSVTNMYTIVETMAAASKVIKP